MDSKSIGVVDILRHHSCVDRGLLMICRKLAFLALCALSGSAMAQEIGLAKAHPEYHVSLGGKFIDHLAESTTPNYMWEANYYAAVAVPAGKSGSPASIGVIVFGPPFAGQAGGSQAFFKTFVQEHMKFDNLVPAQVGGAECMVGKRKANPAYEDWICHSNGRVIFLTADNSGSVGKVDGRSMTERVIAKVSGQADAAASGDWPALADFLVRVRPGLFANIPREVLVKALQNKEKGLVGAGPTESIRRMKKGFDDLERFAKTPLPTPAQLVAGAQPDAPKKVSELVFDILQNLPEDVLGEAANGLIGWAAFYKDNKERMEKVRDQLFIPALADEVWKDYARARGSSGGLGHWDAWTLVITKTRPIRSAPEFQKMSDSQFNTIFPERLRARWEWMKLENARRELARDIDGALKRAAVKWEDKLSAIHSEAQKLLDASKGRGSAK